MSRLRRFTAALALGLCVLLAPLARAWTFTHAEPWPDGPVPIAFGITPLMPADRPASDWEDALRAAAFVWNVSLQRIRLEVGPTTDTAWYENGRHEVFFDRNMFDDPFPSGVLAVTAYTHDRGTRVETDIVVNRNWNWAVYAGSLRIGQEDLGRVLIHELGHFLGLDHPDEAGQRVAAIMNSTVSNVEALTADDIAGARALYDFGPGVAPMIVYESGNTTAKQGTRATLRVLVGGRRPLRYEWRRNGVTLPDAAADTLSLAAVRLDDAGEYTVTAANAVGGVTSRAMRLTVSPATPPSGEMDTRAAHLTVSTKLSLLVTPRGDAPFRYEWKRNGVPLPGATRRELVIEDVQLSDAGDYTVTISNAAGSYTTPATPVVVSPAPPLRFLEILPDRAIVSGGTLRMDAPSFAGDAKLFTFQWQKDGVNIPGATRYDIEIAWFRPEDAGRYRVVVSNAFGSVASNECNIACYGGSPLRFLFQSASRTLETGQAIELGVPPGNPTFSYQWYKDDVPLQSSSRHEGVSAAYLRIMPTVPGDAGVYTVEIGDGVRRLRSQGARLSFRSPLSVPPLIVRHPQSRTILLDDQAYIFCEAGINGARYQWYKDGRPLLGQNREFFVVSDFMPSDVGVYTVEISDGFGRSAMSEPARLDIYGDDAPLILKHPVDVIVNDFSRFFITSRPGKLQYRWYRDGVLVPNALHEILELNSRDPAVEGTYHVVVTDGQRTEVSRSARARKLPLSRSPEILSQPTSASAVQGSETFLGVNADGAPAPQYQWYRDGVAIPGATDSKLRLRNFQFADVGSYSVTVFNSIGSVTSRPATLTIDGRSQLINLATRAHVGRADDVLIAGFTISGTESRQVLVRGVGDQLSEFGVGSVLRDPVLKIFDGKGKELASNDDWFSTSEEKTAELAEAARQVGAFGLRDNARDAVLLQTLVPGSYTAQVSGLVNTTGVGLVEIYELGRSNRARLVNLSSRAVVGTGANILIPGLVLQGSAPRRLLIRAVGPGLAALGVARALADPQLKVLRSDGATVGENNNWGEQAGAASPSAVATATTTVGGFPLTAGSRDAAVLLDLPAGSYTIQVSGVNDTEGIALVEVYEVP